MIQTAKFDPPAVRANLDRFAEASSRVLGFADGRLSTSMPWLAAVGDVNGVGFSQMHQLVFRESWFGEGWTVDVQVVSNATHLAARLRAAA